MRRLRTIAAAVAPFLLFVPAFSFAQSACSVWTSADSIYQGQSATLSWNADLTSDQLSWAESAIQEPQYGWCFLIPGQQNCTTNTNDTRAYLSENGSASITPTQTTSYHLLAWGNGWDNQSYGPIDCGTVTVNVLPVPPAPTLTISADSASIAVGQSTGIHATFAAGSGDSTSNTALNEVPPNGGEFTIPGYGYNPVSRYDYTFTPSSAGTYTFKPYIITSYYNSWNTWGQSVTVTVTNSAATCTISFDTNPLPYGSSTTIHWSSANASTMYINSIGYVSANQSSSATISPSATTDYSCTATGSGGNGTQAASLTVTPPSAPTATISSSNGTTVPIGQSTLITAHFTAGSGDTLTHDNIDSPQGTGVGASTNPDATKTYTFIPSTPGSFVFYARAQTSYFTSWTTYAGVTITVPTPPTCSVTISPNPIAQGHSATVSWTSSNAAGFRINQIGYVTPNQSNSTSVSPSQSTDYTGTATSTAGTATCPASSGTPAGTLNVSCTPSTVFTCSNSATIASTTTDVSCNVSTHHTTCTAPAFCSAGSSSCLYPPVGYTSFTSDAGDNYDGHLALHPQIVNKGLPVKLFWDLTNVSSCSVSGTNHDSFSGGCSSNTCSSGTAGQPTSVINQQTTYTLSCTGLDGSSVNESATVNVLPVFREN
jgi:hypothetical protein